MISPIKKYEMDKKASWEVRYKKLEKHHREETQWLIDQIKRLEEEKTFKSRMEARLKAFDTKPSSGLRDLVIC